MSDYKVKQSQENSSAFIIIFSGPKNTIYQDGIWKIHVLLPEQYPYKSPSIGFLNKIYHPNVDEESGSVCLDVINQAWSPMYDLINIFDIFLPQLLTYPNPHDPLNPEAASLMNKDIKKYEQKVKDHIKMYASDDFSNQQKKSDELVTRKSSYNSEDNNSILSQISVDNISELSEYECTNAEVVQYYG